MSQSEAKREEADDNQRKTICEKGKEEADGKIIGDAIFDLT